MAETLELPAVGRVDQKWVWAGGALVAGIVGYAYFSRSRDPGVIAGADTFPDAGTGGAPGYQNPDPNNPPSIVPGGIGSAPQTDVEWSARVTEALGNIGIDVLALSRAIGKYLTRQPLTAQEAEWIQTAWAYVGRPPGGNYPIVTTPAPTTPPPTTPPPAAWKNPVTRKAAGPVLMSIKTPSGGRRTWAQLVPVFYNNVPPDAARINRAAAQLKTANAWRGRADGSGMWATVGPLRVVSVPSAIYV